MPSLPAVVADETLVECVHLFLGVDLDGKGAAVATGAPAKSDLGAEGLPELLLDTALIGVAVSRSARFWLAAEPAPYELLGLADAIVDIVETGTTIKENGLEII